MIRPCLRSGVEQGDEFAAFWIRRFCRNSFGLVAQAARKPQVFLYTLTAAGFWEDVFQRQWHTADNFLRLAVAAAMACLFCDAPT